MKKVSFISPLRNESAILERGLKELESFVQKFPLQWELLLVIDPSQDSTVETARSLKSEKVHLEVIENSRVLGRGPSVLRGLQKATGDYILVFPFDSTIPLAELFQFLNEVVVEPAADVVLGNRNTSRKKWEAPKRTSWHWTLEKIILEKLNRGKMRFQDPLCPYLVLQRSALDRILPQLKLKSWYYTPEIIQRAEEAQLKVIEVPILSRDTRPSQIPLFKEYLRHFF